MKKHIIRVLYLLTALSLSSCGLGDRTPKGYVDHCIRLLDRQALYADTPQWKETRKALLEEAKSISTMEEAHDAVSRAAKIAGGKHSRLAAPIKDTTSYPEVAPEVELMEGNIVKAVLPFHMGIKVGDSLYVHTVLDFLQEHLDAAGVVLDLRGNTGGNMYPMIAAVSALLPDGVILHFKGRGRTFPISLEFVMRDARLSTGSIRKFPSTTPIAILVDDWTASSGEATLLCFRGLDNVRTFGVPTAGYASANVSKPLSDGYTLVITTSCDMARTGEVFCDDPIQPDVKSETPLEDAIDWIGSVNR